jgi:hypothetical protein
MGLLFNHTFISNDLTSRFGFGADSSPKWPNIYLEEKVQLSDNPALYLLVLSALLIIITKSRNTKTFGITFSLFWSQLNFESTIKESWPLFGLNSWILTVNFVLNFAVSLYFVIPAIAFGPNVVALLETLSFSISFVSLAFISMTFINFLSGSVKIYQTPIQVTWVLPQFAGIFLFCVNLAWLLNPSIYIILTWLFFGMIILVSAQRFLRSASYLLSAGIEWYYILLYLCTLEIIPLLLLVWFFFV